MSIWLSALAAGALVSVVSFVGAFSLLLRPRALRKLLQFLVGLAVGMLLGEAFIHLIPHAVQETGSIRTVSLFVIVGILLFFFLEKVVRWQHYHEAPPPGGKVLPMAPMNLIGDAAHNFIDGTLIAGGFLVSPTLGWTTTAAIIAHEIPQEIGDLGVLVYGGYSPRRAVWLNFLCSLTCVFGVTATLLFGTWLQAPMIYLLPIAAGSFIYIAASDLIPTLHNKSALSAQYGQGVVIGLGAGLMLLVGVLEGMLQ
jgi:zinc and cadmium transporter